LTILIIVILVFIIIYYSARKRNPGRNGERIVANRLRKLESDRFRTINDVLILTGEGYSQIDHIVVSVKGLFVIETKNYSGRIYGNENAEYWTEYKYRQKYSFRNPIKQNWAHIYALKHVLLNYQNIKYHSIIVLVGDPLFERSYSGGSIVNENQLSSAIKDNEIEESLSLREVKDIIEELARLNLKDKEARREHILQVQKHVNERKLKESNLICPRCGGSLVVRNGPYGKFYGCSNYPKCRYKLSYDD